MGQKTFVPISVRGPLDTANPISDRAPGTLVDATDLATRWWGPRKGGKIVAHPHSLTTNEPTPALDFIKFTNADTTVIQGYFHDPQQVFLPDNFTLDIVLQVSSMAHTTGADTDVNVLYYYPQFAVRLVPDFDATDKRKVLLIVNDDASPDLTTIMGSTALTVNSTFDARYHHHIRVVRSGATWTLYVDGTSEGSDTVTTLEGDHSNAFWMLGGAPTGAGVDFAAAEHFEGWILYAHMQKGAAADGGSPAEPLAVRNENTFLHVIPTRGPASEAVCRDLSRYRADGKITAGTYEGEKVTSPYKYPVQCLGTFEDQDAKSWNIVMCGGTLFWEKT